MEECGRRSVITHEYLVMFGTAQSCSTHVLVCCWLHLMFHLDGSMNLNTEPKGDVVLGCDVARKYNSPGQKA